MTERPPSDVIRALRRMIEIADTKGWYQLDGVEARWLERAIELIGAHGEQEPTC